MANGEDWANREEDGLDNREEDRAKMGEDGANREENYANRGKERLANMEEDCANREDWVNREDWANMGRISPTGSMWNWANGGRDRLTWGGIGQHG